MDKLWINISCTVCWEQYLGFLQNGVDHSAISRSPKETDETKDAGH